MRSDIELYGNGLFLEYNEKWRVGYRYYDMHTDEIWFPFGHGLHYTTFEYKNAAAVKNDKGWELSFDLTNAGEMDGAEAVQLYVGDPVSTVSKPIKELKQFEKVFLKAGETKRVTFQITDEDLSYYNVSMHKWVVENGVYDLYLCASSQDIRLKVSIEYNDPNSYSMQNLDAMIG
jgi:beta-glucosidase